MLRRQGDGGAMPLKRTMAAAALCRWTCALPLGAGYGGAMLPGAEPPNERSTASAMPLGAGESGAMLLGADGDSEIPLQGDSGAIPL